MNTNKENEMTEIGLTPDYDEQPSAFGMSSPAAAPCAADGDGQLVSAVWRCQQLYAVMVRCAQTARNAVVMHLWAKLNLACVLRQLERQCAAGRVAYGALFEGYKGAESARKAALAATGSKGLPFTYATARNYVKGLLEVERRMQEDGGMTPAVVAQMVNEHAAQLVAGGYDDPEEATAEMWARWVTENSLRELYMALAPGGQKVAKGDKLSEADKANAEAAKPLDALCAEFLTRCGGFCDSFTGYVESMAARVTAQERERVATRLEEMAAALRATKTRPAALAALPNA